MSERRVDEVEAVRRIPMMTRLGSCDGSFGIWRIKITTDRARSLSRSDDRRRSRSLGRHRIPEEGEPRAPQDAAARRLWPDTMRRSTSRAPPWHGMVNQDDDVIDELVGAIGTSHGSVGQWLNTSATPLEKRNFVEFVQCLEEFEGRHGLAGQPVGRRRLRHDQPGAGADDRRVHRLGCACPWGDDTHRARGRRGRDIIKNCLQGACSYSSSVHAPSSWLNFKNSMQFKTSSVKAWPEAHLREWPLLQSAYWQRHHSSASRHNSTRENAVL